MNAEIRLTHPKKQGQRIKKGKHRLKSPHYLLKIDSFLLPGFLLSFPPTVFFLLPKLIEIAVQTQSVMTAYHPTTIRASPLLVFFFKEFIDPLVSDVIQVLNHAHVVFGPVTLIEGFQPAAGEVPAFITEPYKSFPNQVAVPAHEYTVSAARQASCAVFPLETFLVQVDFHRQVADTNSAIHPAGGNEIFIHGSYNTIQNSSATVINSSRCRLKET